MSDIGTVLKQEIARLARRELRSHIEPARKASAKHRRDIAALKRELSAVQARLRRLEGKSPKDATGPAVGDEQRPVRFVAKGMRSMRVRLGLSGPDLAKLLGVSEQSIYNWEQKKTVPRREQVLALAGLRTLGKREAQARLEKIKSA